MIFKISFIFLGKHRISLSWHANSKKAAVQSSQETRGVIGGHESVHGERGKRVGGDGEVIWSAGEAIVTCSKSFCSKIGGWGDLLCLTRKIKWVL